MKQLTISPSLPCTLATNTPLPVSTNLLTPGVLPAESYSTFLFVTGLFHLAEHPQVPSVVQRVPWLLFHCVWVQFVCSTGALTRSDKLSTTELSPVLCVLHIVYPFIPLRTLSCFHSPVAAVNNAIERGYANLVLFFFSSSLVLCFCILPSILNSIFLC